MNFGPRLDLRQSQSLVMTPQLQQAIKLLALSNLEIEAFVSEALEANPLLELGEAEGAVPELPDSDLSADREAADAPVDAVETGVDRLLETGPNDAEPPLDVEFSALHGDADTGLVADLRLGAEQRSEANGEGFSIEERGQGPLTLTEHLLNQIGAVAADEDIAFIARYLIGLLDDTGYLTADLRHVAGELDAPLAMVEAALAAVQSLDPTGVGARNLAECLALQAREADRYDPCMASLIDNLDLIAKGNLKQLRRICNVDDEDFADMLAELRGYDPKPGLRFGKETAGAPVVPDILVQAAGGGWDIAINPATLPRLCVNRSYYLELRGSCEDKSSRAWLNEKLADANWLLRALDQRQKTILKVAREIVKQQEGFFRHGVSALKPLTLREVAEAIEMHESTVSRVTANKYLNCARGTFELKYFFTSGVASSDGGGAVSAEAVKAQIRALVDAEDPSAILSDDTLVDLLKEKGFDLARRTVAKYREAIGIGSSVQRRRQKALAAIR
ncbi:RNA polymerase factor sigma-54 [Tsuneonella sp. CC-YZS046]|uniref:RNA polymerase factor sigma-54 n=1 Tax=Tsuneonella sp. CC-YZS046 TaxID=3042152 RepID=UPI002D77F9B2|nr:RNA polymerase factor sigma-54 [Tsuneonella sp. CC-YZS046]WRO65778.1 RNA polymerase factor sigma-54 [Tsuneonella sp. CC-YZS046]